MDTISFLYWKKNYKSTVKKKTYYCIHNDYIYGEGMDINKFSFVYYEGNQKKTIKGDNNSLKKAYVKFVQIICTKSNDALSSFLNAPAEKFRLYTQESKDSLSNAQKTSTRIKEESSKIIIKGIPYYIATNLKVGEYLYNLAERLPNKELSNYSMQLESSKKIDKDGKMDRRTPNQIYIRKIVSNHDLTHEINIGKPVLNSFFENNLHVLFYDKNDLSKKYEIDINSSDDDPRLGKDFKKFLDDAGKYSINDLVVIYKVNKDKYLVELIKQNSNHYNFFDSLYNSDKYMGNANTRHTLIEIEKEQAAVGANDYVNNYEQIIYYGVPGSGKSNKINYDTRDVKNDQKIRVVFHPEYTNADFVGQILPIEDNGVDYRFKAGPFTRLLKKALRNPAQKYYLIIEEINRGNAAAIFGDLFQLLDRDEKGWSLYPIENIDINAFLRSNGTLFTDKIIPEHTTLGSEDFSEETRIRLPPNLAILATMNTSDQNVFTLDNAFQRRWDMELISNSFDFNNPEEKKQASAKIEGLEDSWGNFQKIVNKKITEQALESGLSSMEDKRLGCWFVKPDINTNDDYTISKKLFSEKVLKYLWDDAFKFDRTAIFNENFTTLEEISRAYQENKPIFKNLYEQEKQQLDQD